MRAHIIDSIVPRFDWVLLPVRSAFDMVSELQSYSSLFEQNQRLRQEIQKMKAWKEAAIQLEQQNARLLDLNGVRIDPKLTHVTGQVLADSGSRFRQSVLINVGRRDGIQEGWSAMDGIGLVGRISGVGERTSRVLLLNDSASRIPVSIQPSGQRALLSGDNSPFPILDFIEDSDVVRPGDRIISSGDGGVFPGDLLVGYVVQGAKGTLRARLSADYKQLRFLRVLRSRQPEEIRGEEALIGVPDKPLNDG